MVKVIHQDQIEEDMIIVDRVEMGMVKGIMIDKT